MLLRKQKYQTQSTAIEVPVSKSIANRVLIIEKLLNNPLPYQCDADDVVVLREALNLHSHKINVGHAGTAYRFLTAFFAIQSKTVILTGSARMLKRPIAPLVDALNALGANITYLKEIGYPPLEITGRKLTQKQVEIDASISSQFISALLLIAPMLSNELNINWKGSLVSEPYVQMTLDLMHYYGANFQKNAQSVVIKNIPYQVKNPPIEYDWSAMAFWYNLLLIHPLNELHVAQITQQSIQGDALVKEMAKT